MFEDVAAKKKAARDKELAAAAAAAKKKKSQKIGAATLAKRFCATVDNSDNLKAFKVAGRAVQGAVDAAQTLVAHLERFVTPKLKLKFKMLAADFIKDENEEFVFVNLKAFEFTDKCAERVRKWAAMHVSLFFSQEVVPHIRAVEEEKSKN